MDYVRRGAIPEGLAALSDEKVKMEQYFMDNRGYAGKCTGADAPYPVQVGKFAITCALPGASAIGYTLTATGSGTVDQFIYTIDNRDTKTTASTGVWGKSSTATPSCWILKKDGSC
ncbi:MAG: type IV pilin protein [Burkholderiales bacterium]|nr:type IV pilin protein [Burkholderiales bacterium]